uniref:Odorant receptor n=1 Tax=Aulacocentrum confusum TaxID=2767324 RepID=A0A7G8Z960_9HYME|nr:olfactory receptor 41 [Aulacocentrum confusum]
MTVMTVTFTLLTIFGLWRPIHWRGYKSLFYNLYTGIVIFLCYSFTLSEFLDLLLISNSDMDNFANNAAVFLAMIAVCAKIAGILLNRNTLFIIQQLFENKPFKAEDDEDQKIQQQCDHLIRFTALAFISIHEIGGAALSCSRIFADRQPGELPFRAWLPYNYSSISVWYISTVQQIITVFISGHIIAVFDLLYTGMMLLVCTQVKMLKHRFNVMLKDLENAVKDTTSNPVKLKKIEQKLVAEWVKNHLAILRLSDFMHCKFSKVVLIQYSVSAIIVCTTVYTMNNIPIASVEFTGNLFYLFGETFEVFIECVSANEATLEFADLNKALYNTNWFTLSNSARESMIIIMSKAMKPVVFTCGYIIELSLDSFKSVSPKIHVIFIYYILY